MDIGYENKKNLTWFIRKLDFSASYGIFFKPDLQCTECNVQIKNVGSNHTMTK